MKVSWTKRLPNPLAFAPGVHFSSTVSLWQRPEWRAFGSPKLFSRPCLQTLWHLGLRRVVPRPPKDMLSRRVQEEEAGEPEDPCGRGAQGQVRRTGPLAESGVSSWW